MVRVPVRVVPGFASKVNTTSAPPVPLALLAFRCSHESFAVAVQLPVLGTTLSRIESVPAAGPSRRLDAPRLQTGATGVVNAVAGAV